MLRKRSVAVRRYGRRCPPPFSLSPSACTALGCRICWHIRVCIECSPIRPAGLVQGRNVGRPCFSARPSGADITSGGSCVYVFSRSFFPTCCSPACCRVPYTVRILIPTSERLQSCVRNLTLRRLRNETFSRAFVIVYTVDKAEYVSGIVYILSCS